MKLLATFLAGVMVGALVFGWDNIIDWIAVTLITYVFLWA